MSDISNKIKEHALETPNREVCGFIININGVEEVFRARNISDWLDSSFSIHPQDYLDAKKQGEIVAIYHSHTKTSADPSPADTSCCEKTKLNWYIYSIPHDIIKMVSPIGAVIPLMGRVFVWGIHDCFTLIKDYYSQELKIEIPDFEYEFKFWEKGKNDYIDNVELAGFVKVDDRSMKKHDVILMKIHALVPNHAGIYLGDTILFHHLQNRLSSKTVYGGYWRLVTVGIYRHKEMMK